VWKIETASIELCRACRYRRTAIITSPISIQGCGDGDDYKEGVPGAGVINKEYGKHKRDKAQCTSLRFDAEPQLPAHDHMRTRAITCVANLRRALPEFTHLIRGGYQDN